MKTSFLIDGFNFYHSIKPISDRLLWFDYDAYCRHFMRTSDTLDSITYFSALATWRENAAKRHQVFLQACEIKGIITILGKFKEKKSRCPECHQTLTKHEEKATDVNIALYAYRYAAQGAEQIIFVTGDTDLIPAIRLIKKDFPKVRVGVIFPFKRDNRELVREADFSHRTRVELLETFRLPDKLTKPNGKIITCPEKWQ